MGNVIGISVTKRDILRCTKLQVVPNPIFSVQHDCRIRASTFSHSELIQLAGSTHTSDLVNFKDGLWVCHNPSVFAELVESIYFGSFIEGNIKPAKDMVSAVPVQFAQILAFGHTRNEPYRIMAQDIFRTLLARDLLSYATFQSILYTTSVLPDINDFKQDTRSFKVINDYIEKCIFGHDQHFKNILNKPLVNYWFVNDPKYRKRILNRIAFVYIEVSAFDKLQEMGLFDGITLSFVLENIQREIDGRRPFGENDFMSVRTVGCFIRKVVKLENVSTEQRAIISSMLRRSYYQTDLIEEIFQ